MKTQLERSLLSSNSARKDVLLDIERNAVFFKMSMEQWEVTLRGIEGGLGKDDSVSKVALFCAVLKSLVRARTLNLASSSRRLGAVELQIINDATEKVHEFCQCHRAFAGGGDSSEPCKKKLNDGVEYLRDLAKALVRVNEGLEVLERMLTKLLLAKGCGSDDSNRNEEKHKFARYACSLLFHKLLFLSNAGARDGEAEEDGFGRKYCDDDDVGDDYYDDDDDNDDNGDDDDDNDDDDDDDDDEKEENGNNNNNNNDNNNGNGNGNGNGNYHCNGHNEKTDDEEEVDADHPPRKRRRYNATTTVDVSPLFKCLTAVIARQQMLVPGFTFYSCALKMLLKKTESSHKLGRLFLYSQVLSSFATSGKSETWGEDLVKKCMSAGDTGRKIIVEISCDVGRACDDMQFKIFKLAVSYLARAKIRGDGLREMKRRLRVVTTIFLERMRRVDDFEGRKAFALHTDSSRELRKNLFELYSDPKNWEGSKHELNNLKALLALHIQLGWRESDESQWSILPAGRSATLSSRFPPSESIRSFDARELGRGVVSHRRWKFKDYSGLRFLSSGSNSVPLNEDVLSNVLSFLPWRQVVKTRVVCSLFKEVASRDGYWFPQYAKQFETIICGVVPANTWFALFASKYLQAKEVKELRGHKINMYPCNAVGCLAYRFKNTAQLRAHYERQHFIRRRGNNNNPGTKSAH